MNTVPDIISTKDLAYLEDMFNWNFNASKKANHFAAEVTDPDLKQCMEEAAVMHANHAKQILNILGGGQNGQ
ncbi:MAG: spore coat protein [Bacilli bacterium]|nr:spore coat protein [Bacilli bacterium]